MRITLKINFPREKKVINHINFYYKKKANNETETLKHSYLRSTLHNLVLEGIQS